MVQVKSSADLGLLGAKQAPAFSGRYKVRACSLQSLPAPALTPPMLAVGIGIATCEGVLDGVLEPHWP